MHARHGRGILDYREVLGDDVPWLEHLVRAPRSNRIPTVLTRGEVRLLIGSMSGTPQLIARLLYGSGMRLLEGLRVRAKDLDFSVGEIMVRNGKGDKDRTTMLPRAVIAVLREHLQRVRELHDAEVAAGFGSVWMPDALAVKYPSAQFSWGWQWAFPSSHRSVDPRSGVVRRHHLGPHLVQRAVQRAARKAGIAKAVGRTRCGIRLRRTFSRAARTFAPCRSCSATVM